MTATQLQARPPACTPTAKPRQLSSEPAAVLQGKMPAVTGAAFCSKAHLQNGFKLPFWLVPAELVLCSCASSLDKAQSGLMKDRCTSPGLSSVPLGQIHEPLLNFPTLPPAQHQRRVQMSHVRGCSTTAPCQEHTSASFIAQGKWFLQLADISHCQEMLAHKWKDSSKCFHCKTHHPFKRKRAYGTD